MGAPKKADWREERRKRAWKLKEQGWQQKDIAVTLGISEAAVSQWMKTYGDGKAFFEKLFVWIALPR